MTRKRRVRLSFIGGRRPSLCKPPKIKIVVAEKISDASIDGANKDKTLKVKNSNPTVETADPCTNADVDDLELASLVQSMEEKEILKINSLKEQVEILNIERERWINFHPDFTKLNLDYLKDIQVPEDLKKLLEFDCGAEIKEFQELYNTLIINKINLNNMKEELNQRKEELRIKLEEFSELMLIDNTVFETPRQLIKKIVH